MKFGSRRIVRGATGTLVLWLVGALSAYGQDAAAPRPQMAEEVFKNVTVLKGIPVDEFMDTMGMIAAALSANCVDCHTRDSEVVWENFGKETPMKQRARGMMLMVAALNKNSFRGAPAVTCYTCHRGDRTPKVEPSLTLQYGVPIEDPNEVPIPAGGIPGAPSADEVFAKYIQAIGGAQRVGNITSIVYKGTYSGYDTDQAKVPVEVYAKAPDQRATMVRALWGNSIRTYDGRAAWISSSDRPVLLMPLTGGNLDGARTDALLSFPNQLKAAFREWRVGVAVIGDDETQVLQGINPGKTPVNLYFNQAGLLIRAVRHAVTPIGTVPTQIEFSDYRDVSGLKVPFKWISTWTDGESTAELTEVQLNVPIDASKFARPPAAPPLPR